MTSQLSARLEARRDLVDAVRGADRTLMPSLLEYSPTARALWDLAGNHSERDVLTLVLTDPWGSAAGDFGLDELHNERQFRRRVRDLIGDMIMPRQPKEPRVHIELRDAFVPTKQLEELRLRLGQIQEIEKAGLRLRNQVRFVPQRPDSFLLTDFAIEVDRAFERPVREVVAQCGLQFRDDPRLIEREGVREALLQMLDRHRREGQPTPEFALCFLLQDRETIHLLEVSQETPELGDGGLDGIGFTARGLVPYAQSLKIYLVNPNDLRVAARSRPDHPLFNDLRNRYCEFLLPDDGGEKFREEFPELLGD